MDQCLSEQYTTGKQSLLSSFKTLTSLGEWKESCIIFLVTMVNANGARTCIHPYTNLLLYFLHKHENFQTYYMLTLTLPSPSAGVSLSLDSYCSLKPLCSGMGEVVPARTSPTLLPPSPRTVLSLSCFKVHQLS